MSAISSLPHFYYSDRITGYSFGPKHPLKPERLFRTMELLGRYGVIPIDPGPGRDSDVLRVHSPEYMQHVKDSGAFESESERDGNRVVDARFGPRSREISDELLEKNWAFGFGSMDNPAFPDMHEVSLEYVSSVVRAAEAVRDGARLSFGIGGGLHHALRSKASGFCIYDDPAIAVSVLRERFDRVAYIDIDVHHGDGVQWIWYDDPSVLTCSIHEEGKTLWPGTGYVDETGAEFSALNVPMQARTTGDVWLDTFRKSIIPATTRFNPGAIVLQMGTDIHVDDPLAHLRCRQQDWLNAIIAVKELGLPIVAVGGGGYNLSTVPRMWASACLTLGEVPYEDALPPDLASQWGVSTFSDHDREFPSAGGEYAAEVLRQLRDKHPLLIGN